MAFKDLGKKCPVCETDNKPSEGQVLKDGYVLYKYLCGRCEWPYTDRREMPPEVGPLKGFFRPPARWEK